eukprot:scaffold28255_cov63-Phaeocystis_antarctica.AAC.4
MSDAPSHPGSAHSISHWPFPMSTAAFPWQRAILHCAPYCWYDQRLSKRSSFVSKCQAATLMLSPTAMGRAESRASAILVEILVEDLCRSQRWPEVVVQRSSRAHERLTPVASASISPPSRNP